MHENCNKINTQHLIKWERKQHANFNLSLIGDYYLSTDLPFFEKFYKFNLNIDASQEFK